MTGLLHTILFNGLLNKKEKEELLNPVPPHNNDKTKNNISFLRAYPTTT